MTTPTPADTPASQVVSWLDRHHPHQRYCPKCGDDCSTIGITRVVHFWDVCNCGNPEYSHLVEQLAHVTCFTEGVGLNVAVAELLRDASYVTGRYKLGKATAERIDRFLEANPIVNRVDGPDNEPECQPAQD